MSTELDARIAAIYARQEEHILPYIGAGYSTPTPMDLRVMVIGTHAYHAGKKTHAPENFAAMFAPPARFPYARVTLGEATRLTEPLAPLPGPLHGRSFVPERSLYATNAVKVWVPAEIGKSPKDICEEQLVPHDAQWQDEVRALRDASALPHVMVIFSKAFWARALETFHPEHGGGDLGVESYTVAVSDLTNRLIRVVLPTPEGPHIMLMARLRHPFSPPYTPRKRAAWLSSHDEFKRLAAL